MWIANKKKEKIHKKEKKQEKVIGNQQHIYTVNSWKGELGAEKIDSVLEICFRKWHLT